MRTTILPSQRTGLLFPQTIMRVPKLRWMSLQCQYNEGMFPTESVPIQFRSAPHSPYNDVWILWKYYETNMISIQSSSLEGTLDPWTAYKYHTCIESYNDICIPTKNVDSPSYNHLQIISISMPSQTSMVHKFTQKKYHQRNPRTLDPSEKMLLPIHATRNAFPQSQGCGTQIAEIPPASVMPVFRFEKGCKTWKLGCWDHTFGSDLGSPFFWWKSSIIKTCLG